VKTCLISSAVLVVCPAPALGGLVFFDDFEGNALAPHWSQPPAPDWQYNVSNSMLNVTALLYPSHPKSPVNLANMGAPFAPQMDFQLDANNGGGVNGVGFSFVSPYPGPSGPFHIDRVQVVPVPSTLLLVVVSLPRPSRRRK
jgi:hypothetical protein